MRISDWSSDVCSSDLESWLAHDFGTSSPSATYVLARSPGATGPDGLFYPHGSIVVLDELATSRPNRPTEGLGWTVPRLAEAITQMCGRWDIPPRSEEHTSELQSLMRISYAVFCLKKKNKRKNKIICQKDNNIDTKKQQIDYNKQKEHENKRCRQVQHDANNKQHIHKDSTNKTKYHKQNERKANRSQN